MAAVIPDVDGFIDLVGLVDAVDCFLVVPEAGLDQQNTQAIRMRSGENKLFNGDVVAKSAEFSLDANSGGVVGARLDRVEGAAALGVGVVMVVLDLVSLRSILQSVFVRTHAEVASSVIEPTSGRIHQPRGIQLLDTIGQPELRVVGRDLTPAFIIDDLS